MNACLQGFPYSQGLRIRDYQQPCRHHWGLRQCSLYQILRIWKIGQGAPPPDTPRRWTFLAAERARNYRRRPDEMLWMPARRSDHRQRCWRVGQEGFAPPTPPTVLRTVQPHAGGGAAFAER